MKLLYAVFFSILPICSSIRVLHMTDIHIDLKYKVGSATNCILGDTGLGCCRSTDVPKDPAGSAGLWGDINCDNPLPFLNGTLHWIIDNTAPIDVVLLTGDFVDHHDFVQSWDDNKETIQTASNTFSDVFSIVSSPPIIIPILGNHDTYPVDQLIPIITAPTILGDIGTIWSSWLLSDDARTTFKKCGYYTGLVPRLGDRTRVLVLNSLYYDTNNAVVIADPSSDICKQEEFITNTVQSAQTMNETIWLLGHIPPGSGSCTDHFAKFLVKIATQYPETITYHFWGHTHSDEFRIYRPDGYGYPTGMFIAPSLVAGSDHDPAFRIYTYNPITKILENYEQYYCRLTNIPTFPGCYKVYDAVSRYDMTDVSSLSVVDLAVRIDSNDTLFNRYAGMIKYPRGDTCCKRERLCDMNFVVQTNHSICMSSALRTTRISLSVIFLSVLAIIFSLKN